MGCGPVEFVKGAVLDQAKIIDSRFTDGIITGSEINNSSITGNIEFDPDALARLVEQLLEGLKGETLEEVTINNPTLTGDVSFDDEALDKIAAELLDQVAGTFLACSGLPLVKGTRIATCEEMTAAIAAATDRFQIASVFQTCEGTPLPPGTQLMSCAEIDAFVRWMICEGCGGGGGGGGDGDIITSTPWNADKTVLTINVRFPSDGSTAAWPINFEHFMRNFTISALSPATTVEQPLPARMYGTRNALMGTPDRWLEVEVSGETLLIPAFLPETVAP